MWQIRAPRPFPGLFLHLLMAGRSGASSGACGAATARIPCSCCPYSTLGRVFILPPPPALENPQVIPGKGDRGRDRGLQIPPGPSLSLPCESEGTERRHTGPPGLGPPPTIAVSL